MDWITIAFGLALPMWPWLFLSRLQHLTESELINRSDRYRAINQRYGNHIFWSVTALVVSVFGFISLIQIDPDHAYAYRPAMIIGIMGLYSLLEARFALRYGVFPASKFFGSKTLYVYDEQGQITNVAHRQTQVTITVLVLLAIYLIVTIIVS